MGAETCQITIRADTSAVKRLLEGFPEASLEVVETVFDLVKSAEQSGYVEIERTAAIAGDIVVFAKPTDAFDVLCATLRARNGDVCIIKHIDSPAGPNNGRMTERAGVNNPGPGGL